MSLTIIIIITDLEKSSSSFRHWHMDSRVLSNETLQGSAFCLSLKSRGQELIKKNMMFHHKGITQGMPLWMLQLPVYLLLLSETSQQKRSIK